MMDLRLPSAPLALMGALSGALIGALISLGVAGCSLTTEGLDYKSASGAGGAGGASTSTSTTSTSAVSTSGGGSVPEGCDQGFECVAKITDGSYARRAAVAPEECPLGWKAAGQVSDGTDPGCTDCACSTPVGGACLLGNVHRWGSKTCAEYETTITPVNGMCTDVSTGASGYAFDAPTVLQGSCAPTSNAKKPVEEQSLCTFDPAGGSACEGGVCVPVTGGSFSDVCVLMPSGSTCEPGWETKYFIYGGYTDSRVCSCACGNAGGGACSSSIMAMYGLDLCGGNVAATIPAGTACKDMSAQKSVTSFKASAGAWKAGACDASIAVVGNVAYNDAKILCCRM